MTDPFENVVGAVADVGERLVEYAEVWRKAIDRNAAGTYAADDFLVDLQSVWGMSVRDAARVGAAFVDGLAPLLADDAFGPGPKRHDGETTTATTNPTTPKVARASPAATRSAEERRPA